MVSNRSRKRSIKRLASLALSELARRSVASKSSKARPTLAGFITGGWFGGAVNRPSWARYDRM